MFTDEAVTEFMTDYYKDFNYVKSVLDMEFGDGFKLYNRCIQRVKDEHEKEVKNKYWDLFIIECQNGFKGTFEEYYKSKVKNTNYTENIHDKDKEIERIRNKVKNI